MSLGPTFVESQQGTWYKNPVVRRPDWFICWDEDEPIELVIKRPGPSCEEIIKELAGKGWSLKLYGRGRPRRSHRCFTGDIKDPMHPAEAYFLQQLNGPTDELLRGCEVAYPIHKGKYMIEGTYYSAHMNGTNS